MYLIELKGNDVFQNRRILGYVEHGNFHQIRLKLKDDFNIEIDNNTIQLYNNPLIFQTKDDRDIEVIVTHIYKYF
jgi:hypothetical protein